jgi:CRISPR-associated exonuclease Cas4
MGPQQVALALGLVFALALAFSLWRHACRIRYQTGLPKGRVIYADVRRFEHSRPLHSSRYGLSGKPDYLVRAGRQTIPVEVKPGRRAAEPYDSDVMQLAAYCLLVEETTGVRPTYGLLRYRERTFRIPFDQSLRQVLLTVLSQMRRDLHRAEVSRDHNAPLRCRFCGHVEDCDQRLVD